MTLVCASFNSQPYLPPAAYPKTCRSWFKLSDETGDRLAMTSLKFLSSTICSSSAYSPAPPSVCACSPSASLKTLYPA